LFCFFVSFSFHFFVLLLHVVVFAFCGQYILYSYIHTKILFLFIKGDVPVTRLIKTSEATTNGISKAIVQTSAPLARLLERNKDYVYTFDQANELPSWGKLESQNKANFEEEANEINENDEKSSIFRKMEDFLFRRKNRNGSNRESLNKADIFSEIFGYQNHGKEEESKTLKRWIRLGKDPKSLRNISRVRKLILLFLFSKDYADRCECELREIKVLQFLVCESVTLIQKEKYMYSSF
jgi:sarcosine oxidase delta subunit